MPNTSFKIQVRLWFISSKTLLLLIFLLCAFAQMNAQVYFTRTGHVHVESKNAVKKIEADNFQVLSSIDLDNASIKFEGLLKSFEFKLGALDRMFSSEKVNVSQYPKFRFEGSINNLDPNKLNGNKAFEVEVNGTLYLWDEKRKTRAKGTITPGASGQFTAESDFIIRIEEKSMRKLNKLLDEKLPDIVNLSTDSFGVDRDIRIKLSCDYKPRNW